jgi:hypothetical protein
MTDSRNACAKRLGQLLRSVTSALEQVKCDSLRRLFADARHALKRIDQANQQR